MTQTIDIKMVVTHDRKERQPIHNLPKMRACGVAFAKAVALQNTIILALQNFIKHLSFLAAFRKSRNGVIQKSNRLQNRKPLQ